MSLSKRRELAAVARTVCRDLRRSSTPAELVFWKQVRNRRFLGLKFYRQHPLLVDNDGRETFFVADFYCHEMHLVIELDGKIHDYTAEHDRLRTQIINDQGIRVVRFTNAQIESDIERTMERLKDVVKNTELTP